MTAQIANTIQKVLQPQGVAVVLKAEHHCADDARRAQARHRHGDEPHARRLPRQPHDAPGIPDDGGRVGLADRRGRGRQALLVPGVGGLFAGRRAGHAPRARDRGPRRAPPPARAAVSRRQRGGEVGSAPAPLPDVLQAADHGADLVVQERSAPKLRPGFRPRGAGRRGGQRLHRRFRLARHRAERREVVAADENLRRPGHGVGVERARHHHTRSRSSAGGARRFRMR